MRPLTFILFTLLLAAGGLMAAPAETNSAPDQDQQTNSAPGQELKAFELVARKNIFDQSRTGISSGNRRPRAPRIERIILGGIAAGLGDAEANFGGIGSSDRMLKIGDHIGGFRLSQITPDSVKLTDGTNTFVLDMDTRRSLRRVDNEPWEGSSEQSEPAAADASTNAAPESASATASAGDAGHPGESAIERKLRLRREQEEK